MKKNDGSEMNAENIVVLKRAFLFLNISTCSQNNK